MHIPDPDNPNPVNDFLWNEATVNEKRQAIGFGPVSVGSVEEKLLAPFAHTMADIQKSIEEFSRAFTNPPLMVDPVERLGQAFGMARAEGERREDMMARFRHMAAATPNPRWQTNYHYQATGMDYAPADAAYTQRLAAQLRNDIEDAAINGVPPVPPVPDPDWHLPIVPDPAVAPGRLVINTRRRQGRHYVDAMTQAFRRMTGRTETLPPDADLQVAPIEPTIPVTRARTEAELDKDYQV